MQPKQVTVMFMYPSGKVDTFTTVVTAGERGPDVARRVLDNVSDFFRADIIAIDGVVIKNRFGAQQVSWDHAVQARADIRGSIGWNRNGRPSNFT